MHIHIHTYEKKAVAPNPLNTWMQKSIKP
jgi:hypothetical protein